MPFPVVSTSTITPRMKRAIAVAQRRPFAEDVTSCGVFNCKITAGTTLYSAHALGDAGDFMAAREDLRRIAYGIVEDAEKRTKFNRFRKTDIVFVVFEDRQWVKGEGWSAYGGVRHTNHVHAACSFSTSVKPPCA